MLEGLFGSRTAEQTLFYLTSYDEGYAREMARTFDVSTSQINKQLIKFADAGLLTSRMLGRTRLYEWNPRNPLVPPLKAFLAEALDALPEQERQRYYLKRTRPRTANKPLTPA